MNNFKTINYEINNQSITVYLDETNNAYLIKKDIANLFNKKRQTIEYHLNKFVKNEYAEKFGIVIPFMTKIDKIESDGKTYSVSSYHLELVIQIGYRIHSSEALRLKEYLDNLDDNNEQNLDKVIIYNNNGVSLNVKVSPEENTVWLSQDEICVLFDVGQSTVSEHIKNILNENEINENRTYRNFRYVDPQPQYYKTLLVSKKEGARIVKRTITYYSLDMILAIGYRVKTIEAALFRKWVANVLNQYLLKGHAINRNRLLAYENNLESFNEKLNEIHIDIKRLLDNNDETLIKKGQYFDANIKMYEIISSANEEIIIIDTYFDLEGLKVLSKAKSNIRKKVFLNKPNQLNQDDINKFRQQYGELEIYLFDEFHDRFIIIDRKICYSIGTSFNSLANKTSLSIKVKEQKTLDEILKIISIY